MITEKVYLSSDVGSKEELAAIINRTIAPDATSLSWIAMCPRKAYYALVRKITPESEFLPLKAGKALHAALEAYYVKEPEEYCLQLLAESWGKDSSWRAPPDSRFSHLHLGHLEVILKNYFRYAKLRDMFKPVIVEWDDLDLSDVLGGVFRVTDDGKVVLGESKVAMRFEIEGKDFIYSGIPDLPIYQGDIHLVLDHKTTSAYLSEWYFKQYKHSNQLRGYCLMAQSLLRKLKIKISGALINAIYVGERASLSGFKGDRFSRYGPMMYQPGHLAEAVYNQYHWRKMLDVYSEGGFWPQHASKLCSGCPYDTLCTTNPAIREHVIDQEYTVGGITPFLDI